MFYLIDNPPHVRQFRERGTTPSGVIVFHTAESTPDWVGDDAGAEAVARFIQTRTTFGSYHVLCDSDSILPLVPPHMQAYGDGTGSNPHAYHVSAATQAAKWAQAPQEWREETARNMGAAAARYAKWLKIEHGIDVPSRRVTKAESDARKPGFIAHGTRDPERRTDPGPDFPWDLAFEAFDEALTPPPRPTVGITRVLEADTEVERRAALRRLIRNAEPPISDLAQRWLTGLVWREKATEKISSARTALRELEVKG